MLANFHNSSGFGVRLFLFLIYFSVSSYNPYLIRLQGKVKHIVALISAPLQQPLHADYESSVYLIGWRRSVHTNQCRITCKCSESAQVWRVALYKSDQQQQQQTDC